MAVRKINKTELKKTINESVFDPNAKTPLSVIVQMDNPQYGELRAIELINEAQVAINTGSLQTYHDKITQAIALLGLARVQRGTFSL